jgi:hypothetical protein
MRISSDGYLGVGTTDPYTPIHITHAVTDPTTSGVSSTADAYALYIDNNLSGSGATGGDRHQGGIFVDVDTTTTGGDTGDEHRVYGIYSDVRQNTAGDSDLLYGVYSYVESQRSGSPTTTTTNVRAIYGAAASDENANCTIGSMHGVYGYSSIQDAGTVSATYGGFSYVNVNANRSVDTNNIRGHGVEVDFSGGRTGGNIDINFVRLYEAIFDHNVTSGQSTATVADGYLFYGDYNMSLSSEVTTKWGIYTVDEDKNYFSGKMGIGTTTPDARLEVESEDGSIPALKVYRNDSSTSAALVYLHDDSVYVDNPVLHVKNDRTDASGFSAVFEGNVGINETAPDVALEVQGAGVLTRTDIVDISANTSLSGVTHAGRLLRCTSACTLSLQATPTAGEQQIIYNDSSGTITISANGSDTINGSTNDITITSRYKAITVIAVSASAWLAIGA